MENGTSRQSNLSNYEVWKASPALRSPHKSPSSSLTRFRDLGLLPGPQTLEAFNKLRRIFCQVCDNLRYRFRVIRILPLKTRDANLRRQIEGKSRRWNKAIGAELLKLYGGN